MNTTDMQIIRYLGYEEVYVEIKRSINPILKSILNNFYATNHFIESWDSYKLYELKSLEAAIETVKQLYGKRSLKLHPVYIMKDYESLVEIVSKNSLYHDDPFLISEIEKRTQLVSPFDIPIVTNSELHMEGETEKAMMPYEPSAKIRFRHINLHNRNSLASALIYAHEIAHTQTESHPGYAKNLINREVVPVFLEKAFALDLDPSGALLKTIEKGRILADAAAMLNRDIKKYISSTMFKSYHDALRVSHFFGTLLGTALFDKYQHETLETQAEYFRDVQRIFDGELTVEAFLGKRKVSMREATDTTMLSRHL